MIAYLDKYDATVEIPDDISAKDLTDVNENFHSYIDPKPNAPAPDNPAPEAPTAKWTPNFYESAIKPAMTAALRPDIPLAEFAESPQGQAFGSGIAKGATFGATPNAEEVKDHPAFETAGEVAGGVGSLLVTGGALEAAGLGVKASLAGKAVVDAGFAAGERFIPRAIMSSATFGTRTFIAETVKAFQDHGVNLPQFGEHVLTDTAFGAILGPIGGLESVKASVSSAAALGFISSKMAGGDNREATLHGAIWAAFELAGSAGRSESLRMEAMGRMKESIGEYIGARNPEVPPEAAARSASEFVDRAVRKAGYDTAEDIAKSGPANLLEGIEKVNQMIRGAKVPAEAPSESEPLPKLPGPIEPGAGAPPEPEPQTPLDKAIGAVKDLMGIKPEPTPEAPLPDLKADLSKGVSEISGRLSEFGMNDEETNVILNSYGTDKIGTLGQEVIPTDRFRLPIEEQYHEAYSVLARERGISKGIVTPEMEEWAALLKTGIKPPPDDVKNEYAQIPLWMKKGRGLSYDQIEQSAREQGLLQPNEDLWVKLRELRISKPSEKYDERTMQDARRAVDLINDYFNPQSQEIASFAVQHAGQDENDVAQMAHNRGLLEEPSADLMKLEIQKAQQEHIVGTDPENVTARFERLVKQAKEQGLNPAQAETWAKSQLRGPVQASEPKPEQKEFGDTGGVKSFGKGKAGEGEFQFSMAPEKTEGIKPAFFSMVERTITQKMPGKAAGNDVLALLRNTPGIKQDEIDWIGLPEFLKDKSSVTKMEVQDFVRQNQVQIKEVTKGEATITPREILGGKPKRVTNANDIAEHTGEEPAEDTAAVHIYPGGGFIEEKKDGTFSLMMDRMSYEADNIEELEPRLAEWISSERGDAEGTGTKFGAYQLPGGSNYREMLLTLPSSTTLEQIDAEVEKADELIEYNMRRLSAAGLEHEAWAIREGAIKPETLPEAYRRSGEELLRAQEIINRNPEVNPKHPSGPEDFKSGHFDEPNILAHVRFNDRTDADGKKVLFLEEVQSDWHQEGREQGYQTDKKAAEGKLTVEINPSRRAAWEIKDQSGEVVGYLSRDIYTTPDAAEHFVNANRAAFDRVVKGGVPDAPFKKTWHELALKRMLRYAAENGYDKIAWTTGEQQAERYDLSKQIDYIEYWKNDDGTYDIRPVREGLPVQAFSGVKEADLPGTIGKDIAKRMAAGEGRSEESIKILEGDNLKVGGEGMKGFYDQMIPSFLNKYTKKWGGKVGETKIGGDRFDVVTRDGQTLNDVPFASREEAMDHTQEDTDRVVPVNPLQVHSLDVTRDMKLSVMQGQPQFSMAPNSAPPRPSKIPKADAQAQAAFKLQESASEIQTIVNPASAAPLAAAITREQLGKMARAYDMAEASLEQAKKYFDSQPKEANIDFIDQIERGEDLSDKNVLGLKGGKIQTVNEIAKQLRKLLDDKREEVRSLGKGKLQSFIENYFPHIWDQGEKEVGQAVQKAAKRPFEGSKGFLKKRSIEFTKEGIEMGLTPVSYNPVDLTLLKLREMDKFIMAHKTINEYKANGLAKYVKVGDDIPEGWTKIDDRISTIFKSPMVAVKEAYDAKMMADLNAVAKSLGIDLERGMKARGEGSKYGDVWGLSMSDAATPGQPGRIFTRFAGPESALAHELGHQIDHIYGLQSKLLSDKKIDEELTKLADERLPEDYSEKFRNYVQQPSEKMAVMFEAYIHAPELFKEIAPRTYKELVKLLKEDPDADQFLDKGPKLARLLDIKPSLEMGTNTSEVYAGGNVIAGHIFAQPDAARIINNYLSPGLQKSAMYQAYRYAGNLINQFQLGLSAFHLGFTSLDASVSKFALALNALAKGHPLSAVKSMIETPIAPIQNVIRGDDLLKAWRGEGQSDIDKIIAEAMATAGGRARMDQFYATKAHDQMKHYFQSGNIVKGLLHIPLSIVELTSKPILEYIVPRQKLGVFSDMMQMELANNPNMTHQQVREIAQRAWDSVDNRMGQMVYDNLFWNRTFKDLLMGSVRSVGWNLGTIREILGGAGDYAKAVKDISQGKKPEFSYRMAYLMALPIVVGVFSAITQYLRTGKGPQELKDYYFPQSGGTDAHGDPRRVSPPSYMKDLYHWSQDPVKVATDKLNPLLSMVADMLQNKDYFGTKIRNEDDPLVKQVQQEAMFILNQVMPFSIRNMQKNLETGNKSLFDTVGPWVGLTPAPYDINQTKAERAAHEIAASHQEIGGRTQEQAERSKLVADLTRQYKQGDPNATANLYKAYQSGLISHRQMREVIVHSTMTPLQRMVKGMSVQETQRVYEKANDEEKPQIERILRRKELTHDSQFVAP